MLKIFSVIQHNTNNPETKCQMYYYCYYYYYHYYQKIPENM